MPIYTNQVRMRMSKPACICPKPGWFSFTCRTLVVCSEAPPRNHLSHYQQVWCRSVTMVHALRSVPIEAHLA